MALQLGSGALYKSDGTTKFAMLDNATLEVTGDYKTHRGDQKFPVAGVLVNGDAKFRANILELDVDTLNSVWGWAKSSGAGYTDYTLNQSVKPNESVLIYKVPYDVANPNLTIDFTLYRAVCPNSTFAFKKEDFFNQEIEFQLLGVTSGADTGKILNVRKNV